MASTGNPHDLFFRRMFGRADLLRDLVRHYLPAGVVAAIKAETVELIQGTFVDDSLAEHRTDLLCRVEKQDGGDAYLYLLFEHKSYPDRKTVAQVFR
ncbi:MAG: Rpn family recombination-promoting nuclease/putative transposase, partial [Planctomycetota bacterium]